MPTKDLQVDSYIQKAAAFAQPILIHLRNMVHAACPAVVETIKWGCPHFMYRDQIVCSTAAFKQHCAFTIRKARLLKDEHNVLEITEREAMGHLGKITSLKDLPKDAILKKLIKDAAALNEEAVKLPKAPVNTTKPVLPDILKKALQSDESAAIGFKALTPGQQRDYIQWITEAKTPATIEKRLHTLLQWAAAGKSRNWKYMKK